MANTPMLASSHAANILKELWTDQFGADPTEEAIAANLVTEVGMIGKKLHLRKIKALTSQQLIPSSHTTNMTSENLTYNNNTEVEVTVTPLFTYCAIEFNEDTLNELVDDGPAIAVYRKQMLAELDEDIDTEVLELAQSASLTEVGADFDEPLWRAMLAKLAKNAKRKFRIGKTPYNLIIHPNEIANALNIEALRSYIVRGTAGSAVSGALVTTYGANIEESGLVSVSGATAYMPMFIKDAWALGYNKRPGILTPQQDGYVTRFLGRAEYGVAEYFDSSIVVAQCTV